MGAGRVWVSVNGVRHDEPLAEGLPTWDLYFAGASGLLRAAPRHLCCTKWLRFFVCFSK